MIVYCSVLASCLFSPTSLLSTLSSLSFFFFFNDTATTEIYTLSLHDALPISGPRARRSRSRATPWSSPGTGYRTTDRKSTRLNSSHGYISYAVFCLKKKKKKRYTKKKKKKEEK